MATDYEVIIAGGGPVGLFLACELGLRGVRTLVLERMADPRSPLKSGWMGMRGLNVASAEAFYRRGLLDTVRRASLAWVDPMAQGRQATPSQPRFAGHFAGFMLEMDKIDFSAIPYLIAGPAMTGGMVTLEGIEELLAEKAADLSVEIRRGQEVTGFTESAEGVSVQTGGASFQSKWLVGCDGGRSTIRKAAGFAFEGTEPELTGYTASAELADPEKLGFGFQRTERGMYIHGPGPGRIGVIDFDEAAFDRTQEITRDFLQSVLQRVSGTDVTITALHVASSYTDRARQATTYRKGRVLLAGDAAHIHSPLGGQGMNTGLGDAMNLGWKLAATVQGWAPEGLLDSYTSERHPAGAWALDWTRAQVATLRPDPHARAIATVVRDLIATRQGTSYIAGQSTGIMRRYDLGNDHPLVGRSAPDFLFADGSRLGSLMHEGKGVFLDLSADGSGDVLPKPGCSVRLMPHRAEVKESLGLAAVLVRPDGIVAWAADAGTDPDRAALQQALSRWLGNPVG